MPSTRKKFIYYQAKQLVILSIIFFPIMTGCLNPTSKPVTHILVINDSDFLLWFYLDRQDTVSIYSHKDFQFNVAPGQYVASAQIVGGVLWGPETLYVAPGETDTLRCY